MEIYRKILTELKRNMQKNVDWKASVSVMSNEWREKSGEMLLTRIILSIDAVNMSPSFGKKIGKMIRMEKKLILMSYI